MNVFLGDIARLARAHATSPKTPENRRRLSLDFSRLTPVAFCLQRMTPVTKQLINTEGQDANAISACICEYVVRAKYRWAIDQTTDARRRSVHGAVARCHPMFSLIAPRGVAILSRR
jgi:hypothetical protein